MNGVPGAAGILDGAAVSYAPIGPRSMNRPNPR